MTRLTKKQKHLLKRAAEFDQLIVTMPDSLARDRLQGIRNALVFFASLDWWNK